MNEQDRSVGSKVDIVEIRMMPATQTLVKSLRSVIVVQRQALPVRT